MNNLKLALSVALFTTISATAQNNTNPWPATGNVGIGNPISNFTLQLHGTTDYSVTFPSIPAQYDINGNLIVPAQSGYTTNYGKTSRLGFTNSTTLATSADGMLLRMSGLDFVAENLEKKDITITSNAANMKWSGVSNRIWVGTVPGLLTASTNGYFNITTTDNGLFVRTTANSKFGISVQSNALSDNAIQVMGTTGTTRNFAVKANGEVYARKYTTTLAAIPDYVFQPSYQLMPLSELKTYITLNNHLPNIPSAQEYAETGVDLGELNRLLLEKVEELTLYILQLEERMKTVEAKQ